MATFERRVQVLFDAAQYAALEQEAVDERLSVAAVIREAVDERLRRRRATQSEALTRLFARADANPISGPIDWVAEKDSFERQIP